MQAQLQQFKVVNYTALFIAFAQGSSLEDIADEFNVAITGLRTVAREQRWPALALQIQSAMAAPADDEQRIVKLQDNRDINLRQAQMARDELDATFEACTLWGQAPIAPQIIKELVTAMATVHDLTYRALGDKDKQQQPGQGGVSTKEIHFHLPGAIAKPREERVIELAAGPPPPPPPPYIPS